VLVSASLGCGVEVDQGGVRVVLITLDTLRFDHFESDPNGAVAMPLTSAHARRGIRFDRYYSVTGMTQPTHATLFTGMQPWEHGVTRNGMVLSARFPSIAERFKDAGFETRAVIGSFPLADQFGFGRGFDEFDENFSEVFMKGRNVWEGREIPGGEFFSMGEFVTDQAIRALDRAEGKKQFFWFHYFDPHSPYGASRGEHMKKMHVLSQVGRGRPIVERLVAKAKRLYAQDVAYLDESLARLLDRLHADEDSYVTHVFVVSDHGESFGEGDSLGHGFRLTEEQLHVPAFLLSPNVKPQVRTDVAASIDVPTTLLSLAGIEADDGREMPGRDLTRSIAGDASAFAMRRTFEDGHGEEKRLDGRTHRFDGYLFCEIDSRGRFRRGNAKGLVADGGSLDAPARERLIDRFRSFEALLDRSIEVAPLDPEVERGLEALGYAE
jgi:arylsulfatase A-like enzyme